MRTTPITEYGTRDYRGGGRQSARETRTGGRGRDRAQMAARERGVSVRGYMAQLGPIAIPFKSWDGVYGNPFLSPISRTCALEAFMTSYASRAIPWAPGSPRSPQTSGRLG